MKPRITDLKNELRREYKEKRRSLPIEAKSKRDEAICKYVINMVSFRYAKSILMYAPMADEIDVMPIAKEAMRRGKKVYFPRCHKETKTMTYKMVSDLSELAPDAYGIMAPPESAEDYAPANNGASLCLIPGLIYDKYGYRVGYGGGYYDRFLTSYKGCTAGIIYSDFIIDKVPRGHFDMKLDIMITERNVRVPLED